MDEEIRQCVHMAICAFALCCLYVAGRELSALLFLLGAVAALFLLQLLYLGAKLPVLTHFFGILKRRQKDHDLGLIWYLAGLCIIFSFLPSTQKILVATIALGIGDGLSTLVGMKGTHHLPYNRKKTLEGMCAIFFASCLPAVYFFGAFGVAFGIVVAVVESLPLGLDDNLSIPVAAVVALSLI